MREDSRPRPEKPKRGGGKHSGRTFVRNGQVTRQKQMVYNWKTGVLRITRGLRIVYRESQRNNDTVKITSPYEEYTRDRTPQRRPTTLAAVYIGLKKLMDSPAMVTGTRHCYPSGRPRKSNITAFHLLVPIMRKLLS
jgi:hypothetical protein